MDFSDIDDYEVDGKYITLTKIRGKRFYFSIKTEKTTKGDYSTMHYLAISVNMPFYVRRVLGIRASYDSLKHFKENCNSILKVIVEDYG